MFLSRGLRFVLYSRDLDILRARRLFTHNSTRSENPITWLVTSPHILCEDKLLDVLDITASSKHFVYLKA